LDIPKAANKPIWLPETTIDVEHRIIFGNAHKIKKNIFAKVWFLA